MARRRPTAWEVSFGKDSTRPGSRPAASLNAGNDNQGASSNSPFGAPTPSLQAGPRFAKTTPPTRSTSRESFSQASRPPSSLSSASRPQTPSSTVEKRKAHRHDHLYAPKPDKRRRVDGLGEYTQETQSTVILGEAAREDFSLDEKPIRLLADFRIFDSGNNEEATLDDLIRDVNDKRRRYEAIGNVAPIYEEEDAGQDEDFQDEIMAMENGAHRLRTSTILGFSINYAEENDPVYLETEYAWYMLGMPSETNGYRRNYMASYRLHRLAQLLLSRAIDYPNEDLTAFKERYLGLRDDVSQARITGDDFMKCAPIIQAALQDPALSSAHRSRFVQEYLQEYESSMPRIMPQRLSFSLPSRSVRTRTYKNNIDLEVLRPENQTQTYVTPLVDRLSRGLFREKLRVAGSQPKETPHNRREQRELRKRLMDCLQLANKRDKRLRFANADRQCGEYWKAVTVERTMFKVGEVVLVVAGDFEGRQTHRVPDVVNDKTVPSSRTLADYFWFGQVVWINQCTKRVHLHWMEHASKTLLQEIHDPQELFMVDLCDSVKLDLVVGKVDVQYLGELSQTERLKERSNLSFKSFFYSFSYQQNTGTFVGLDRGRQPLPGLPPDNCEICLKLSEQDTNNHGRLIKANGVTIGISFRGHVYHVHDFARVKADSGLCHVGQIRDIYFKKHVCWVEIRLLGRISDIREVCPHELKDERHFFLTDMVIDAELERIVGPCQVMNANELPSDKLQQWLFASPLHLYIRYHFPQLKVKDWEDRTVLKGRNARMLEVCKACYQEEQYHAELRRQYSNQHTDKWKLRAFDPFGGVGAFALSMQEAGCLQLTHAVEISPSAAKTLKKNSPDTIVYNQCANVVLEYAIKHSRYTSSGASRDSLKIRTIDGSNELPKPPRPQDIDCIVAGFPCQPHSRLNMFQKANDKKSSMILNLIASVDFFQPKYCVFENVRGFLNYNLNAVQLDEHRVAGGIEMGGLKFLVRSLLALGYQVRFGLLQAAHYGTPQARVRFFLMAAKLGLVLPQLPEPLYSFSIKDSLKVNLPHALTLEPINTEDGIALFTSVTVGDAISDLPRFDWKNPHKHESSRRDPETQVYIPVIVCDKAKAYCGPERSSYHHEPRTLFQKTAREPRRATLQESNDEDAGRALQHFTRVLKDDVVARVVNIPLKAGSDYRALFRHEFKYLWEWQTVDPKSAAARHGYRPGMYGRLDRDGHFRTTVTNVEPTAKQSWVLNPYCKRMVTVRELARSQGFPDWFKFYCVTSDVVKTMHREIGNAVPWPVGVALGRELKEAMFKHWFEHERREEDEEMIILE